MKKCNTQIMKELKKLEECRDSWYRLEKSNCTVKYMSNEEPIIPDYNYDEVTEQLKYYDDKIRRLKGLLAYSNATTIVEGFDMTINEALIYLAQLKQKETRFNLLASKKALERQSVGFGDSGVEFTKILYDLEQAKIDYLRTKDTIMELQMAIDRTNLTNMIEC